MADPYVFAGSSLDRASRQRGDASWLAERARAPASRFLAFWRLRVIAQRAPGSGLAWAKSEVREFMAAQTGEVFLGLRDGIAHFAVDVSELETPEQALGLAGLASFEDVRGLAARLPADEAAIVAQGRALIDWHATHRHCPACGHETQPLAGGSMRVCGECDAEHFPRTNPVVITLVGNGERCLLGRQPGWPAGMFSALAGFVEPGETIEEAVSREVLEETGVVAAKVRYHSSQPWPFPSSLMIGCLAEGLSDEIHLDGQELDDARWFSRDRVLAALASSGEPGNFFVPPAMAIAHHLIRAWAQQR